MYTIDFCPLEPHFLLIMPGRILVKLKNLLALLVHPDLAGPSAAAIHPLPVSKARCQRAHSSFVCDSPPHLQQQRKDSRKQDYGNLNVESVENVPIRSSENNKVAYLISVPPAPRSRTSSISCVCCVPRMYLCQHSASLPQSFWAWFHLQHC